MKGSYSGSVGIRDNTKGFVVWVIIGIVVLFGLGYLFLLFLPDIFGSITGGWFSSIGNWASTYLTPVFNSLGNWFSGLVQGAVSWGSNVSSWFSSLASNTVQVFSNVGTTISSGISGIVQTTGEIINNVGTTISNALAPISNFFTSILGPLFRTG